ncbi:succinate dehydrogenase, hydrophobic membrane anchor protein [Roseomonas sp. OT10]|uniref:succinate dehydrogenase, hydrophobic membrane anchor protein n=1 Tax=Roseomonas cutis TaxID=2897332 RepID=UPI001E430A55|nr:succinate dehydrogenase, hydrophobic membrane anchor protein [Roseomonas sp. OT10]UFN48053.1 succinate dehydrogenase, hydrophobic membrane anchor protein [Roseomonas sp. OT10]
MSEQQTALRLQAPLKRVRGLGSAHSGVHHWWVQRLTSIALLPLTIWFALSAASLAGAPYERVVTWIGRPFNAVLLLLIIGIGFQHTAAGLQVVIEDYVRPESRRQIAVWTVKALCTVLALYAALAVLRIAV